MNSPETDPQAEIKAMGTLATTFAELDEGAIRRVLKWATDRYAHGQMIEDSGNDGLPNDYNDGGSRDFETIADLYNSANPSTGAQKALVAGYWFQYHEGMTVFDAQRLNSQLKHLGHGVSNITMALGILMKQKPQLVMQTLKSGTSRQARKKYKLTLAGKQAVETMLTN